MKNIKIQIQLLLIIHGLLYCTLNVHSQDETYRDSINTSFIESLNKSLINLDTFELNRIYNKGLIDNWVIVSGYNCDIFYSHSLNIDESIDRFFQCIPYNGIPELKHRNMIVFGINRYDSVFYGHNHMKTELNKDSLYNLLFNPKNLEKYSEKYFEYFMEDTILITKGAIYIASDMYNTGKRTSWEKIFELIHSLDSLFIYYYNEESFKRYGSSFQELDAYRKQRILFEFKPRIVLTFSFGIYLDRYFLSIPPPPDTNIIRYKKMDNIIDSLDSLIELEENNLMY